MTDLKYLFQYMEKRFNSIEERFAHLERRPHELHGAVDAYAKRADAYFREVAALSHPGDRHERWPRPVRREVRPQAGARG